MKDDKYIYLGGYRAADSPMWEKYNICMDAVKYDGLLLRFIKKQTLDLCILAISNNPRAMKYVNLKNDIFYLEAVKINPMCLEYIPHQTYNISMFAVTHNGLSLKYIKNKTKEICIKAISNNIFALYYI